jgi:hypothetical protein
MTQPVVTAGSIAGLILAAWQVLVAQNVFSFLEPAAQDALGAFVALLVPIIAAVIASRYVTPLASPNLPIGTTVNANSAAPTGVVSAKV